MLTFEPHKGVEVYAGKTGYICFKNTDNYPDEDVIVMLTIGQFRAVIKNAETNAAAAQLAGRDPAAAALFDELMTFFEYDSNVNLWTVKREDVVKENNQAMLDRFDRNNTDIPKSQAGFIKNICLPLYESWSNYLRSENVYKNCLEQIKINPLSEGMTSIEENTICTE